MSRDCTGMELREACTLDIGPRVAKADSCSTMLSLMCEMVAKRLSFLPHEAGCEEQYNLMLRLGQAAPLQPSCRSFGRRGLEHEGSA